MKMKMKMEIEVQNSTQHPDHQPTKPPHDDQAGRQAPARPTHPRKTAHDNQPTKPARDPYQASQPQSTVVPSRRVGVKP